MCVHENAHNDHILSLRNEICVPILGKCVVESKPSDARIDVTMCANVWWKCFWEFVALQLCFGDDENTSVSQNTKKKIILRRIYVFVPQIPSVFNSCIQLLPFDANLPQNYVFDPKIQQPLQSNVHNFSLAVFKRTLTNNQIFATTSQTIQFQSIKKWLPNRIFFGERSILCCLFSAPYRITQHPERY